MQPISNKKTYDNVSMQKNSIAILFLRVSFFLYLPIGSLRGRNSGMCITMCVPQSAPLFESYPVLKLITFISQTIDLREQNKGPKLDPFTVLARIPCFQSSVFKKKKVQPITERTKFLNKLSSTVLILTPNPLKRAPPSQS